MGSGFEEVLAPNLYFDRHFNIDAAKILPGEYYATNRDIVIVTVLGSCVSLCLRDRVSGIGGMNHFMLPHSGDGTSPVSQSARYGSYAMEVLINHLLKLGARRDRFEAKLFGGGAVLKGFTLANVGERNVRFALDYLKTENIQLISKDLLDEFPRKVYFFPATGKVLVKKLRAAHNNTIVEREREYEFRLDHAPLAGDIELFDGS